MHGRKYSVFCQAEDSAREDGVVLFWIDDVPLQESQLSGFSSALNQWASEQPFRFRIFLGQQCLHSSL